MHESGRKWLILGIESSCDETSAAVVGEGSRTLSNIVASQMALHATYGGVVPELAAREHLRNIVPVVREALREAGVAYPELAAVAVTQGPGLAGALLVGITFAKALAFGLGLPLIGVNHLEGHIHAVLMEGQGAETRDHGAGPLLALVVSGGHTHLYLASHGEVRSVSSHVPHISEARCATRTLVGWEYRNVGRTVDDAAGEAYDKVAKLLGLGYPGGPWIDALAQHGDARAVPFSFGTIKTREFRPGFSVPNKKAGNERSGPVFDFSFSGIKTAVLRHVETHGMKEEIDARRSALAGIAEAKPADALVLCSDATLDLIASFQAAVVGNLVRQTFAAAETFAARTVLVSGGVAANRELRARFRAEGERRGVNVAFPSIAMSTDNAAMIAAAAWPKFIAGDFAEDHMAALPQWKLGQQP